MERTVPRWIGAKWSHTAVGIPARISSGCDRAIFRAVNGAVVRYGLWTGRSMYARLRMRVLLVQTLYSIAFPGEEARQPNSRTAATTTVLNLPTSARPQQ